MTCARRRQQDDASPDFDGYLFAIPMGSDFGTSFRVPDSWSDRFCPSVAHPTALANTTSMSHGLSVFLLIDSGSAVTSCPRDRWNISHLSFQAAGEIQAMEHNGEKGVILTTAGAGTHGSTFRCATRASRSCLCTV